MRTARCGWAVGVAILVVNQTAMAGPSWVEPPCPNGDAGSTGSTAQSTTGSGTLGGISGNLCGAQNVAEAFTDFEDVYRIRICNPKLFSARTAANFNAQLWLFTDDGRGLLGNDDHGEANFEARISAPSSDGTDQGIPGPGVYLLAISGFNNDPFAPQGPIFAQDLDTEVSGPDGFGGDGNLDGWSSPGETGGYVIILEGAALLGDDCTDPRFGIEPVPAVSEWGVLVLALTVLSGGTILLGRR